ncbi:MAG TPA: hypothetical protein VGL91_14615 [Acidobacteriota bacterium]|jgi:hypothetical protein
MNSVNTYVVASQILSGRFRKFHVSENPPGYLEEELTLNQDLQERQLRAFAASLDRLYEVIEEAIYGDGSSSVEEGKDPESGATDQKEGEANTSGGGEPPPQPPAEKKAEHRCMPYYRRPDSFNRDSYSDGRLVVTQDSAGFQVMDTVVNKTFRVELVHGRWVGACSCGMDKGPPPSYQCPHQIAVRSLLFNRVWFGKRYRRRWRGCR